MSTLEKNAYKKNSDRSLKGAPMLDSSHFNATTIRPKSAYGLTERRNSVGESAKVPK